MSRSRIQIGFGLIEIMVGLAIGMIATIVMFQTFAVSESQKRTTTGAADAQSNGAIGMFLMERDIKMAGWGLQTSDFAKCDSFFTYHDSTSGAIDSNATPGSSLLASATIADGGADPDSITIQYYGNPTDPRFSFGVTSVRSTMTLPSADVKVASVVGCSTGNLMLITNGAIGGNCTLAQVSNVDSTTLSLKHEPGNQYPYNPEVADMASWPKYSEGATVQCFPNQYKRTYQVTAGQLELTQPDAAGVEQTFPVAPEILDLQAEYGIADAGSQQVNGWVTATGAFANPTITNIRRIKAVRIALLARSATYEKPGTDGNCSATTDDMVTNWSSWATFDAARLPADWKCYRYKAFEITVPLRNIIWAKT